MSLSKEEFIRKMEDIIPDDASVEYATVTILTKDLVTLNYDTESDKLE